MSWIAAAITAGASMLQGVMANEAKEDERKDKKEDNTLKYQSEERDRANALAIAREEAAAQLQAAKMNVKAETMGKLILDQGKDSSNAMLEAYKAKENEPERFNDSADNLARVLAGRRN